ncbi:MAG: homocysteine S-methyltransferase family protein, partial [Sphingomonadales bacterium]
MANYRDNLPQLAGKTMLTDGGLETTLIFHDGYDLPEFAAYVLLESQDGIEHLKNYSRRYATIAKENGMGFLLETPTWRASQNWGTKIGHTPDDLDRLNRLSVALLEGIRVEFESEDCPCVISGQIGPEGDGYSPDGFLSAKEAEKYHTPQVTSMAEAGADMVCAQ